jgi:hypothetical protein
MNPSPLQVMTDQKLENVEYFNYLGSMINNARCTRAIKSKSVIVKAAFSKKKTLFHQHIRLICKEETKKMLHLGLKTGHFGK